MVRLQNKQTNEEVTIYRVHVDKSTGYIVKEDSCVSNIDEKFCAKWSHVLSRSVSEDGSFYFWANEGWELVSSRRRSHSAQATATEAEVHEEGHNKRQRDSKLQKSRYIARTSNVSAGTCSKQQAAQAYLEEL